MLPVNPFNRGEQKKSGTIRNDSPASQKPEAMIFVDFDLAGLGCALRGLRPAAGGALGILLVSWPDHRHRNGTLRAWSLQGGEPR